MNNKAAHPSVSTWLASFGQTMPAQRGKVALNELSTVPFSHFHPLPYPLAFGTESHGVEVESYPYEMGHPFWKLVTS